MIQFIKRLLPEKKINMEVGNSTDKGMVRITNEDSVICAELDMQGIAGGIYAIADGMGGHDDGEIASNLAISVFTDRITNSINPIDIDIKSLTNNTKAISRILTEAVQIANTEVYIQAQARGNAMGTTLAAALVLNSKAYIVNIGDSRGYLIDRAENNYQIHQITTDHSLVAELVASGEIAIDDIYTHPQRNVITRCLGTQKDIEVDLFTKTLEPGDTLIMCSDGLWEMVKDPIIKDTVLKAGNAQTACDRLVEAANKNGGLDNISVIVLKTRRAASKEKTKIS